MNNPTQSKSTDVHLVPERRLKPAVTILTEQPEHFSRGRDRRRVGAYFSCLTDAQASLLQEVLAELPGVLKSIKEEALAKTRQSIKQAFALPELLIQRYNAEAWAHERWHESYLERTPWITLDEADERCANTPWDAKEDLLALSHRGSWYFPLFLFTAEGPPDPWWIAVLAGLRCEERVDEWKLLDWLLKPHALVEDRSPIEALRDNPKRVLSLAKHVTREEQL